MIAERLERDVVRLVAPNAGPLTGRGTNSYVVGLGPVAVIDPGPDDEVHLSRLDDVVAGRAVAAILLTHAHADHSDGARRAGRRWRAPVMGFGAPERARAPLMQALAEAGVFGTEASSLVVPDRALDEGDRVSLGAAELEVLWLPGHFAGHLAFVWGDALFVGDHIMDWAPTLIAPPDGDLGHFMSSCERLLGRRDRVYYPGHGDPLSSPRARVAWLMAHRRRREAEILSALDTAPATPAALVEAIYADLAPGLRPAARLTVLAHLTDLVERRMVAARPSVGADAMYHRL